MKSLSWERRPLISLSYVTAFSIINSLVARAPHGGGQGGYRPLPGKCRVAAGLNYAKCSAFYWLHVCELFIITHSTTHFPWLDASVVHCGASWWSLKSTLDEHLH